MSEKVILNPTSTWQANLQDSLNPNYGFTRKRPVTRSQKKAVGGIPYTRELANTGHVFNLSWIGRSWRCVQTLKQFYEQYEEGFFTIIDHDGGGRHYVGRFTTEVSPVQTANGMWDVQNVTFEELPQVPMLQYPHDWVNDAVWRYGLNDFGDQLLATSGTWSKTARTFGTVTQTSFDSAGTSSGDWAQYEYRGYGFQLYLLKGPAYGKTDIYFDGTFNTTIDCYAATALGPSMVLELGNAQLDIHRVKAVIDATKNASSTGTAISWWALKVMR